MSASVFVFLFFLPRFSELIPFESTPDRRKRQLWRTFFSSPVIGKRSRGSRIEIECLVRQRLGHRWMLLSGSPSFIRSPKSLPSAGVITAYHPHRTEFPPSNYSRQSPRRYPPTPPSPSVFYTSVKETHTFPTVHN